MYTIVIIRLGFKTLVFENTEVNCFALHNQVENELKGIGCSDDDIATFNNMKAGENKVFEHLSLGAYKALRFAYVFKIS